ncbi:hypothetical protein C5167_032889 [Papaver somniferum]|uniref:Uncharacterized protein n=1 Tax=Papaver somniferum TaxID=3469 RepID=A0A4Y7KC71_PAPSO|nr:hypothetical protein C5167_032889 [Papaver somniferum]
MKKLFKLENPRIPTEVRAKASSMFDHMPHRPVLVMPFMRMDFQDFTSVDKRWIGLPRDDDAFIAGVHKFIDSSRI